MASSKTESKVLPTYHQHTDSGTSEGGPAYKPKYRFVKGFKEAIGVGVKNKIRSLSPMI